VYKISVRWFLVRFPQLPLTSKQIPVIMTTSHLKIEEQVPKRRVN